MTELYIIRHAERWDGYTFPDIPNTDDLVPLSTAGEAEAIKLSKCKDLENINIIYTSPTTRSINTIKYLAEKRKIPTYYDKRLLHRIFGEINHGDRKAVNDFISRQWQDFDYKLVDGESMNEVKLRFYRSLRDIISANRDKKILICSHGQPIATLLHDYHVIKDYFDMKHEKPPIYYKYTFADDDLFENHNLVEFQKLIVK